MPHHVTQRGNRHQEVFFSDDDYKAYLELMAEWCKKHNVEIWAYCLMPNQIHLIAVPHDKDALRLAARFGMIEDPIPWFDYENARNLMSHTYDQEVANEVYNITNDFLKDAKYLLKQLEMKNDGS